jgi:hypothetical protein
LSIEEKESSIAKLFNCFDSKTIDLGSFFELLLNFTISNIRPRNYKNIYDRISYKINLMLFSFIFYFLTFREKEDKKSLA